MKKYSTLILVVGLVIHGASSAQAAGRSNSDSAGSSVGQPKIQQSKSSPIGKARSIVPGPNAFNDLNKAVNKAANGTTSSIVPGPNAFNALNKAVNKAANSVPANSVTATANKLPTNVVSVNLAPNILNKTNEPNTLPTNKLNSTPTNKTTTPNTTTPNKTTPNTTTPNKTTPNTTTPNTTTPNKMNSSNKMNVANKMHHTNHRHHINFVRPVFVGPVAPFAAAPVAAPALLPMQDQKLVRIVNETSEAIRFTVQMYTRINGQFAWVPTVFELDSGEALVVAGDSGVIPASKIRIAAKSATREWAPTDLWLVDQDASGLRRYAATEMDVFTFTLPE